MPSTPSTSIMQSVQAALCCLVFLLFSQAAPCQAVSSVNIPLDSPVYLYLEKLSGFGLIASDIKGIRPFSKAEAARLLLEAEGNLSGRKEVTPPLAAEFILRLRELLPREVGLLSDPAAVPKTFDYNLLSALRLRTVWLDGAPRDYLRPVHDPGNDGVFGIGAGLRPATPFGAVIQRGSEGTPLVENNNGIVYRRGFNGDLRWAAEAHLGGVASGLLEPAVRADSDGVHGDLTRGYFKLGGGGLELEAGKDENWLGLGYRGSITLSNNARNFTLVKLSSPEPLDVAWVKRYLGEFKYSLIASQFDHTVTYGRERQPWFYAVKLSLKPIDDLEIGFSLGRQVGGPGVDSSFGAAVRGLIGGTDEADNSNGMAGFEARYRIPWLRNTELYGEFSGEDTASFWPIVESYLAGIYIPRLTADGRNDFRFEFFQGNQILYTNWNFPGGYLYHNLPIGHSQGGATQDFFFRYSHWFSVRNNLALEYIYTNRGMIGKVQGQAIERKHAGRISWSLPLVDRVDALLGYGIERVTNLNLVDGIDRTNQVLKIELRSPF